MHPGLEGGGQQGEKDGDASWACSDKQRSCFRALWKSRFYLEGVYQDGQGKKHKRSLQHSLLGSLGSCRTLLPTHSTWMARSASTLSVCSGVPPDLPGITPALTFLSYLEARLKQQPGRAPTSRPACSSHRPSPLPVLPSGQLLHHSRGEGSGNNPCKFVALLELFSSFLWKPELCQTHGVCCRERDVNTSRRNHLIRPKLKCSFVLASKHCILIPMYTLNGR